MLRERPCEVSFHLNLSEDARTNIDHWCKYRAQRDSNERCEGIHPEEGDLECRPVDPDVDERYDTIDESKEQRKEEPKEDDKEMVCEELCVLVGEAHCIVECRDSLGALVLVKTFLKVELQRKEYYLGLMLQINIHRERCFFVCCEEAEGFRIKYIAYI